MTEITVSKDSERTSINQARLQYIENSEFWAGLWTYRDYQIELRLGGTEESPYDRFIQLAELVLPKLPEIEESSNDYLGQFINKDEQWLKGLWKLQSLRIRRDPDSKYIFGTEFEVMLSIGEDDYGQWSVRFAHHTYPLNVFSPYYFSRRQY